MKRIVKRPGIVNRTARFALYSRVINGASELRGSIFGEAGRHAPPAVGMHSLPTNMAVETDRVVRLHYREPPYQSAMWLVATARRRR